MAPFFVDLAQAGSGSAATGGVGDFFVLLEAWSPEVVWQLVEASMTMMHVVQESRRRNIRFMVWRG